jgi:hypothetical protein
MTLCRLINAQQHFREIYLLPYLESKEDYVTLKMEAVGSSKILLWCHIPEDYVVNYCQKGLSFAY